jgi:hemolysin activation/secretion protein
MRRVAFAVLLFGTSPVVAQVVPSSVEIARPVTIDAATEAPARPSGILVLSSTAAPPAAASITLQVSDVRLSGNTVLADADIAAVLGRLHGHVLLSDIYSAAQRLTTLYGEKGYTLSRVIVPPQALDPAGAMVQLEAVEGYVDEIVWPESLSGYRDFFSGYAAAITTERPVRVQTLERYLLLAGDLPGLTIRSSLRASATNPRASTLVVEIDQKPVDATASFDNWGSEGRGPYQYVLSGGINNALGLHERLGLTYSGSLETGELQALALTYEQVLNAEGTQLQLEASWSGGAPGTAPLQAINFASRSNSFLLELIHPLVRSREANLNAFAQLYVNDASSTALGGTLNEDRLRVLRFGARFDWFDAFDGYNRGSIVFSKGIEGLGSTLNGNPFASRTSGQVDFSKVALELFRIQELPGPWSVLAGAKGQLAFSPLLASEECGFGGRQFGRAFDGSTLSGDHCLMTTVEVRYDLDTPISALESAQLYAAADMGAVWRISPAMGAPSGETAGSVALGLRTVWDSQTKADVELNRRLWGAAGTPDWRVKFSMSQSF